MGSGAVAPSTSTPHPPPPAPQPAGDLGLPTCLREEKEGRKEEGSEVAGFQDSLLVGISTGPTPSLPGVGGPAGGQPSWGPAFMCTLASP